jgi:two-component sensor histidine kinase
MTSLTGSGARRKFLSSRARRSIEQKNLLANVTSIVGLSQSDTPKGLKEAIQGRIGALASAHSLFAKSRWARAELATLVKQELSPYSRAGGMRTQFEGPTVILKPEVAQAVAVALHELATNAAKYGALSGAKGQVRVEWSCVPDDQLVLRWTEEGGPPAGAQGLWHSYDRGHDTRPRGWRGAAQLAL